MQDNDLSRPAVGGFRFGGMPSMNIDLKVEVHWELVATVQATILVERAESDTAAILNIQSPL